MPAWARLLLRVYATVAIVAASVLAIAAWATGVGSMPPLLFVLVGPAVLLWLRPAARLAGLWAAFVWFSEILFALGSLLVDNHRGELWVTRAGDVFVQALLITLPILAFGAAAAAAAAERACEELSPLARRLRSIAVVAFAIAVPLAVIGFLPGETIDRGDITVSAGGLGLLIFLSVAVSPGLVAYADPRLRTGWRWMMWGLGLGGPAGAILLFDRDIGMHTRLATLWPRHVVDFGVGMLFAMILLVLPIVLVASDDDPRSPQFPKARLRQ